MHTIIKTVIKYKITSFFLKSNYLILSVYTAEIDSTIKQNKNAKRYNNIRDIFE